MAKTGDSSNASKRVDTDATKTIRAVQGLQEDTPINLGAAGGQGGADIDLVANISRQIQMDEAERAQLIAKKGKLQTEMEVTELERQKAEGSKPHQSSLPSNGLLGGFGSGGRSAIVQTILQSIPEGERAAFVKENKDLLLSDASPASLMLAAQKSGGGNGHSGGGPAELAVLLNALGEQQERSILLAQRMAQQNTPTQAPVPAQPPMDVLTIVKELNANNQSMITQLTGAFTNSVNQMQTIVKQMQDDARQNSLNMQEKLIAAQQEAYQTRATADREKLEFQIEQLRQQGSATPSDMIPMAEVPKLLEMFKNQLGFNVSTITPDTERIQRQEAREDRKLEAELEERRLARESELERQRRSTEMISLLKGVVPSALEAVRVERAVKSGGSESSRKLGEGFR